MRNKRIKSSIEQYNEKFEGNPGVTNFDQDDLYELQEITGNSLCWETVINGLKAGFIIGYKQKAIEDFNETKEKCND